MLLVLLAAHAAFSAEPEFDPADQAALKSFGEALTYAREHQGLCDDADYAANAFLAAAPAAGLCPKAFAFHSTVTKLADRTRKPCRDQLDRVEAAIAAPGACAGAGILPLKRWLTDERRAASGAWGEEDDVDFGDPSDPHPAGEMAHSACRAAVAMAMQYRKTVLTIANMRFGYADSAADDACGPPAKALTERRRYGEAGLAPAR